MSKPVVAITRPKDRAKKACEIVEKLGGEAFLAPTLDLKPVNSDSLKELVKRKDELDWIVFTSPTTIDSFNKFYPDFLGSLTCKLAVIGNKTGKLAEENGLKVDLIPEDFTAEGLIEEFKKRNITNQVIGIPRTLSARPVLPEELEKMGNTVLLAEAYKSLFPMDKVAVKELISKTFDLLGTTKTAKMLDEVKAFGYKYATTSGITINVYDMLIPKERQEYIDQLFFIDTKIMIFSVSGHAGKSIYTFDEISKSLPE